MSDAHGGTVLSGSYSEYGKHSVSVDGVIMILSQVWGKRVNTHTGKKKQSNVHQLEDGYTVVYSISDYS